MYNRDNNNSKKCSTYGVYCGGIRDKRQLGQCCSKEGKCGISSDHCWIDKGCQQEFGDYEIWEEGIGNWLPDKCCSKMGNTEQHRNFLIFLVKIKKY